MWGCAAVWISAPLPLWGVCSSPSTSHENVVQFYWPRKDKFFIMTSVSNCRERNMLRNLRCTCRPRELRRRTKSLQDHRSAVRHFICTQSGAVSNLNFVFHRAESILTVRSQRVLNYILIFLSIWMWGARRRNLIWTRRLECCGDISVPSLRHFERIISSYKTSVSWSCVKYLVLFFAAGHDCW